jgi:hypothetical protein
LIRRMSIENPPWGAPRIHGELLKLGFEIAQSSVAKYMVIPAQRGRHESRFPSLGISFQFRLGFELLPTNAVRILAGLNERVKKADFIDVSERCRKPHP